MSEARNLNPKLNLNLNSRTPTMPLRHRRAPFYLLLAATLIGLLSACDKPADGAAAGSAAASGAASGAAPSAAGAASAPPVGVTTVRAQVRDLPVLITATGTVAPLSSVDVRPQTTSLITKVHVKEGQFVKAGELLFTLDTRADEANVAKARAQLARDEAALADAQRQLKRSQELLAQNFISQGALDTNQTNVQSQSAAVAADRAALDAARLGLSYTRIAAPSAGRLGAINVFVGSSVQANVTTLVSITQLDPIAVAFSLPQRHLADALTALKDGGAPVRATPPESASTPAVSAIAPAGMAPAAAASGPRGEGAARPAGAASAGEAGARPLRAGSPPVQPLNGRLKFVDNAVDPTSGTVRVKAVFDNAAGRLWPGAFVNVAMTASTIKGAIVVPQAAIVQGLRGTMVFAVVDGKAVARPVQVLYAQGEDAAVSGLKPGERIVLDGRQNVRPGVNVVERPTDGSRGGRGGAASGAASGAAAGASGASSGKGVPAP
jgi:multidrug efflux pump subunit AcrA (membrane-fusion protein)